MPQVLEGHKKYVSRGGILSANALADASEVVQPGREWSIRFTAGPEPGTEVHCCFAMVAADTCFH